MWKWIPAILVAASAAAQPDPCADVANKGSALLDAGRAGDAVKVMSDAAATCNSPDIWFYLGRAYADGKHVSESRDAYARALALNPKDGAALNNLAQLEIAAGDTAAAKQHLESAIALGNAYRPFYLVNYGDLLAKQGDRQLAADAYAKALAEQPENSEAEGKLLAVSAIVAPAQMPLILWRALDQGYVYRAQNEALQYAGNDTLPDDVRRAFMAVVAVALSRQHLDEKTLFPSPAGRRLMELARVTSPVSKGADDILHLYAGKPSKSNWWTSAEVKRPAVDPLTAFTMLARALGSDSAKAGRDADAEAKFRLAVDMTDGTDPDAVVDLADFYDSRKKPEAIDALLRQYEGVLFSGKGAAIRGGDPATIYRFHYALGTMYARVGKWGNSSDPTSAIYQLEHARAAVAQSVSPMSSRKLNLDPKMVDLLAMSYEKTSATDKAVKLRLDSAEDFADHGRTVSAARVLQPYKESLPVGAAPSDVERFKTLRIKTNLKLETPPVIVPPAVDPFAAKVKSIDDLVDQYRKATTSAEKAVLMSSIRKAGATDVKVKGDSVLVVIPDATGKKIEKSYAINKSIEKVIVKQP